MGIVSSDFGGFTNDHGHFSPHGTCVLALRYEVKRVLDNCGQTAVVVLAKVGTLVSNHYYEVYIKLKYEKDTIIITAKMHHTKCFLTM